jgi:hypothetical protein
LGLEAGLAAIGENIRTQDNRITAHPVFVVQQKRRVWGVSSDYTDSFAYVDSDGGVHQKAGRGRNRVGYLDHWEFVTACFTEKGCQDYLRINGHNLKEPRIYVESAHRNAEWQLIRAALAATASIPLPEEG